MSLQHQILFCSVILSIQTEYGEIRVCLIESSYPIIKQKYSE